MKRAKCKKKTRTVIVFAPLCTVVYVVFFKFNASYEVYAYVFSLAFIGRTRSEALTHIGSGTERFCAVVHHLGHTK